jgi:hypothetical protein
MLQMRKVLIAIVCIFCCTLLLSQKSEEDAIRAVLDAETLTYANSPLHEVWKKHWLLDDKTVLNLCTPDCTIVHYDKDGMMALPNIVTGVANAEISKSDFVYNIHGDHATVSNTVKIFIPEDKITVITYELRVLKKVEGAWKIHMCSLHQSIPK